MRHYILIALACLLGLPFGYRLYNRAFKNNLWRAYQVRVRADLRTFAAAEQAYRARTGRFALDLTVLGDSGFQPSEGVRIQVEGTDSSLRASGTHDFFRPDAICTLVLSSSVMDPTVQCAGFVDWFYRPRRALQRGRAG